MTVNINSRITKLRMNRVKYQYLTQFPFTALSALESFQEHGRVAA